MVDYCLWTSFLSLQCSSLLFKLNGRLLSMDKLFESKKLIIWSFINVKRCLHLYCGTNPLNKKSKLISLGCNLDGYRVKFELPSFFGWIFIFEMNGSDDSCLKYYDIAHFTFVILEMKWMFTSFFFQEWKKKMHFPHF